ncbi:hypothetical protein KP509_17G072000 [Ceratopteris richardii]|uniref:Late embryogenesis abundant protein LEA-2 subgroup domain-containing protein n=1 Tax=Ceratopteris richardii TaxID=49495 RepID=A0A8T2SX78_CERRI|nr:hypothetical protein KP509_17G072000 [Ceratopteris richardii]
MRDLEKKAFPATAGAVALCCAFAGVTLFRIRPRDPIFEVLSITFKGFKFRFCTDSPLLLAIIDAELILSIKVINPNVLPIEYTSTVMDIFYHGDLLGQAKVDEGSQDANSQEVLKVVAKLDGLEMTNHLAQLVSDVKNREMNLHSVVTIKGNARLWKWTHAFEVRCDVFNFFIFSS